MKHTRRRRRREWREIRERGQVLEGGARFFFSLLSFFPSFILDKISTVEHSACNTRRRGVDCVCYTREGLLSPSPLAVFQVCVNITNAPVLY